MTRRDLPGFGRRARAGVAPTRAAPSAPGAMPPPTWGVDRVRPSADAREHDGQDRDHLDRDQGEQRPRGAGAGVGSHAATGPESTRAAPVMAGACGGAGGSARAARASASCVESPVRFTLAGRRIGRPKGWRRSKSFGQSATRRESIISTAAARKVSTASR